MQTERLRNQVYSVVVTLQLALIIASPLAGAEKNKPSAYFILIDRSSSMAETPKTWNRSKHEEVTRQLAAFTASLPAESRVFLYTFARDLHKGPDVILGSDQDRVTLQKYFAELTPDGDRTHLWSALDRVLGNAGRFADQNPGRSVRLLVYSDSEDNEHGGPDLTAVLERHQRLLKEHVKLTYVTLGFTLRSDLQATISEFGSVRASMTAADVLPLIAEFSWVPPKPVAGEVVQFIDHSVGIIRDRSFDFGDGSEATTRKAPQHAFKKPGEYVCRLTLTGTDDSKVVETRTVAITEPPALKPAFRVSAEEIYVREKIILVNETVGEGLTFEWDLGNGKTSTERNPSVVLNKPGEYRFRLRVTDQHGQAGEAHSTTPVRVISLPKPSVKIVGPTRVVAGAEALFFAQVRGQFERIEWLEDGKPMSGNIALRHKFDKAGRHQMTVMVYSKAGDVTATHAVTVAALPLPKPSFVVGSESVEIGEVVVVVDTTTGDVDYVVWDFGAGRTIRRDYGVAAAADARRLVVSFDTAGQRTIELTAFGPAGSASVKKSIQVKPPAVPVARLILGDIGRSGDSDSGITISVGETLRFVDVSTGAIQNRVWTVNEETVAGNADRMLDYTFAKVGDHEVVLAVGNSGGESRRVFHVTVEPFAAPKAAVAVGSDRILVGGSVVFTDLSEEPVSSIVWDFGDGTRKQTVKCDGDTSVRTVSHRYSKTGTFVLTATVTGAGGTDTVSRKIEVRPARIPPVAVLVADQTEGHEELTVNFTNNSSGSVIRSHYDFGDGTTQVVHGNGDVQHTFRPGQHTVRLTAFGPDGIAPSKTQVVITVSAPMSAAEFWGWIGGAGLLLTVIAGFFAWPYIREAREHAESLLVGGVITVKPSGANSEPTVIPLPAESREAAFPIASSLKGVLKSVEGEERGITYQLDLYDHDELTKSIGIPIAKDVTVDGFVFRYAP